MVTMKKVAYICDQKRDCARYDTCQNACFHTTNSLHAKYGVIKDISELESSRFWHAGTWNETDYYIESEVLD